jgi:O-antigen/teichoic acid export membrane protein
MTTQNTRILKTFYYGLFNFLNIFIGKYLLYPILIFFWKIEIFNDWILITNIALQFALLDFGSKTYIGNRLAEKKINIIRKYFKYLIVINITSLILIFIFLLGYLHFFFNYNFYNMTVGSSDFVILIICNIFILVINIFVGTYGDAILRPLGLLYKYQKIDFFFNLSLNLILIGSVYIGAGIIGFSLIQIILHAVKIIFIKYYCDKYSSPTEFRFKGNLIKYKVLKNIIFNSFFFYIGNITNIIQNSTFILLGARGMGIANIGFFILYRTVSNFSNQLQNFISSAFYYEYTRKKYYIINEKINLFIFQLKLSNNITLIINFIILMSAEKIFSVWLKGELIFNYNVFLSLIIASIIKNYSNSLLNYLLAKNKQRNINKNILIFSLFFLIPCYYLSKTYGILGLSLMYIGYELGCLMILLRQFFILKTDKFDRKIFIIEIFKISIFFLFFLTSYYSMLLALIYFVIEISYYLKKFKKI